MLTFLTLTTLLFALITLAVLAIVDLRTRLLPNTLVLALLLIGLAFHILTLFYFVEPIDLVYGALVGGGILYFIKTIAEKFYGPDALGMGDVKLMGVAGIWLGSYYVLLALTVGAIAGLVHGLIIGLYKIRKGDKDFKFSTLNIPAGPGFIIGIIIVAILKFWALPEYLP